jgi:hypothetical protein
LLFPNLAAVGATPLPAAYQGLQTPEKQLANLTSDLEVLSRIRVSPHPISSFPVDVLVPGFDDIPTWDFSLFQSHSCATQFGIDPLLIRPLAPFELLLHIGGTTMMDLCLAGSLPSRTASSKRIALLGETLCIPFLDWMSSIALDSVPFHLIRFRAFLSMEQ